jgi:ABC-type branched-subunit amino acid transport system substrate-binding protein
MTIICGKILNSSIVELYGRNRFAQEPFRLKESLEINLGTPLAVTAENLNFSEKQIFVGSSLDLSKSNLIMGDRVRTGILLGIKQANGSPELKGMEIKDVILDDRYTPFRARHNVEMLQRDFGIDTLLLPIGTPTLLAVRDLIVSGSILAAFPVTGSMFWRHPEAKGAVNYRPSYDIEVEKLIDYLTKEYSFKIFAFFYQEDEYGIDCMKKAREVLKAKGIEKWIELPYTRNTTDFTKQRDLLKNEQVEALGCFSTSQPTQEFLRQVGVENLATVKVFALAFAVDDTFEAFVKKELGLKCLFSRAVPNPKLSKLGIVQEYRHLMDELKKPYDVYSLESYICTTLLCEMIKKSPNNVTHLTLLAQLEALNNYDLKGLTFTFDPSDRQISKRIWFDFQDGADWLQIL